MNTHTPGPWRINKNTEFLVEDVNARGVASTGGYTQNWNSTTWTHDENMSYVRGRVSAAKRIAAVGAGRAYREYRRSGSVPVLPYDYGYASALSDGVWMDLLWADA